MQSGHETRTLLVVPPSLRDKDATLSQPPIRLAEKKANGKEFNQISFTACEWPAFRLGRVHSDGIGKDGRREPCSRLGLCSREDRPCIKPGNSSSVVMLLVPLFDSYWLISS
jgi:hypothetical protein